MVDAALDNPDTAPIRPVVKSALALTRVLALVPEAVDASHIQPIRDAGADDDSIEDIVMICAAFATINRIADSLDFALLTQKQYDAGAKMMYDRGYKLG